MDTLEIVYYTCLNNECPKHRGIFTDGDPQHEGCARERLWLEGQRPAARVPRWILIALPVAAALAAGAILVMRFMRVNEPNPSSIQEEVPMKTWSGAHAHRDDREGNAVPPPIS